MDLIKNKLLKDLTTFKIGGAAKYFYIAQTFEQMKQIVKYAKEKNLKVFILGRGSNVLINDLGFFGLVIQNNISFLKKSKTNLYAGAGYSFAHLGLLSAKCNLSGLEFALGIPGSVGGAIYMNASSYNQSVSDALEKVVFLNNKNEIQIFKKSECKFGYRSSVFQKNKGIILCAKFGLKKDNYARKNQIELFQKKLKTQPLNEKNAGCIFKNPKNYSARKLIEECGLKNFKIGEAKVSDLHANFIINENNASSKDVLKLISHIKKVVKKKKNITLKTEIKILEP